MLIIGNVTGVYKSSFGCLRTNDLMHVELKMVHTHININDNLVICR